MGNELRSRNVNKMFHQNPKFHIAGTGSYAPEKIVANCSLTPKDEWVRDNLGIRTRHIAASHERTSDLAVRAAQEAITDAKLLPNDIQLIIVATATPDRQAPSTACLVQHQLGITNNCPAFDIAAVCTGFLYALTLGSQFLQSGGCQNALIIGADTFSKITDWSRRDCVFFGDGAGAAVIQRGEGLFSSSLYANGAGHENFTVYPGARYFQMNARGVYETATTVLPDAIRNLLTKNLLNLHDVDHVIPHQPSLKVLKKMAEVLPIPFEKVHTNMDRYANTAGATIPILLNEVRRKGFMHDGDLSVFAAVGSGWCWGAGLYQQA